VTAEISYDRFESDEGVQTEFGNLPEKVTTFSVPLGATYFHPNGFFAGLAGTYVDQEVVRSETSIQADGEDSFFLVDAMIGYRFGKRRGVASLGAKNLFDTEFNYQDDSYREFQDEPSTGPYFPSITVIGKLTLNF
jgi:outer membrane receptor for ferric coprogen and ferric-rhodotorulic acid